MSEDFNIRIAAIKNKVFRFALKFLNNREDAQDVVQDLFEKLWKMRTTLNQYENVEALSMKTTKNLCIDKLRHRKIKIQKTQEVSYSIDCHVNENNYIHKDTSEIIKLLIGQLPEKQKMIVHLRDVEAYAFTDIAEIMEIDINAVRMNLSRGRKTIREKLIKKMNYGL